MDGLELASLNRARSALELMANTRPADNRAKTKQFMHVARIQALGDEAAIAAMMDARQKDASAVSSGEFSGLAAPYSAAFIESIAEGNLLDQLAKYATVLDGGINRAMISSGFSANATDEGAPKAISNVSLNFGSIEPRKAAAVVVTTKEFLLGNPLAEALFERELKNAVNVATNQAVLDMLTNTGTTSIAGTGDALADLRAGLALSQASTGYVIAASTAYAADLATRVENRGAGIRGGTFAGGVEIVAIDGLSGLVVIPASRLAVRDFGVELKTSRVADVTFAATPTAPSTTVSLFQTNSCAAICERMFDLVAGDAVIVEVAATS